MDLIGVAGFIPDSVLDTSSAPFIKLMGESAGSLTDGWTISGWDEEPVQFASEDRSLLSASPNPFNLRSLVSFFLPSAGHVRLSIYDIAGREVVTLVEDFRPAGRYTAEWDAGGMSSGVYFARLEAGRQAQVVKMLLVK